MRYLLDTHVWLWMLAAPERLGRAARSVIEDPANRLLLSAASSWEIAIKYAMGRLVLPAAPEIYVPDRMRLTGVEGLAIEHRHATRVASLPAHHRDPFDRMLIAQAQVEGVAVVTADAALEPYGVEIVRAGQASQ